MAAQKRKKWVHQVPIKQQKRDRRMTIMLSAEELELLDAYVKKWGKGNRSAFVRKIVMVEVLGKTVNESPSFFDLFDKATQNE